MTISFKDLTIRFLLPQNTVDYTYPLPPTDLHRRFDPVFSLLNQGSNVTLCRLPHSGVSSLLQFILSDQHLSAKFTQRQLVYLHPESLASPTSVNLYRLILSQLNPGASLLNSTDEFTLLTHLKSQISRPLTIIIDHHSLWQQLPFTAGLALKSVFETGQHSLPCLVNFFFVTPYGFSPCDFYSPLKSYLHENIFDFALFTKTEARYSINRFTQLYRQHLNPSQISQIINFAAGLAGLIKPLIWLSLSHSPLDRKSIQNHPRIQTILTDLLPQRTYIPSTSPLVALLSDFSPPETFGNLLFKSRLTAQDHQLLQFFRSKTENLVSRDDIAQILWGKQWLEKYSDWAIDKAISRLRNKLSPSSPFQLITVKNAGYKLIHL